MAGGGAVATFGAITRVPVLGSCAAQTVPVDVVVTTTYTDLDAVGPIEAPADAQPAPTAGG